MSNASSERYVGTLVIDLAHLSGILYDVARGALRGLRRERPGVVDVIAELAAQFPTMGAAAGISPSAYARLTQATEHLAKIRAQRGAVDKLAEVLKESEALYEDERETAISQMADAIRSTAKREKNPGLSAPFERLLRYNSQSADKAVKTRRKKAAHGASEPEGAE
jgi:hypothetical protein